MVLFLIAAMLLVLVAVFSTPVNAGSLNSATALSPDLPWEITADQLEYDTQAEQYIAKGNVVIQQADKKLSADFVRFEQKTMQAHARGHIVMTSGEDILCGDRIDINLNSQTGTLFNGSLFHSETNFHIRSDRIEKVGKNSYNARKVDISTCEGDHPDWRITGRDLKITIEGYGTIKHAALWAKKMLVMYTPWFAFPVKLKRQSGLLSPEMSFGDRKGFEYIQPIYWAINNSSDATFYEHYMADRGNKLGLEYRYALSTESKGALMFDFFNDRQIDDGTGDTTSDWGYDGDDYLRTNRDRYWFRMKHDQVLGDRFTAKLDLDIVSDQDYLTEFKDGISGFRDSKKYFNNTFGRGFDDYNDSTRVNRFNLNKTGNSYSLNTELRWYDDVLKRRWETEDDTVQQLPFAGLDISRKQLSKSPLYYDLDSEYNYFYRDSGSRGHRVDIHPRVYLPWICKGYFTFEPSFGVQQTAWLADRYEDEDAEKDDFTSRTIYDIKLDLATDLYRVYNASASGGRTWQHRIIPQVVYDYIPDQDQDEYPEFDDLDRIDSQNTITYSIINTFTSKQLMSANNAQEKATGLSLSDLYRSRLFCRIKLEQSYDFDEAGEPDGEPFSPISGTIILKMSDTISFWADADWSTYEDKFVSNNAALKLTRKGKGALAIEDRQQDSDDTKTHSLNINGSLNIGRRLALFSEYEHDFEDDDDLTVIAGFRYRADCWALECKYSDESGDQKFAFMVTLNGLGNISTGF